jgi:hypothetical protein
MTDTSGSEPTTFFSAAKPIKPGNFTSTEQSWRTGYVDNSTTGEASALLTVSNLELSALGANVDLRGNWPAVAGVNSLTSWHEQGQGGRVTNSVTVQSGYLFPLGHRANYVSVFKRLIALDPTNAGDPANYPVAYLQEDVYVVVTEPIKTYPALGQPFPEAAGGTSDWPFSQVRMVTLEAQLGTPPTLPVMFSTDPGVNQAVWPMLSVTTNGQTTSTDVIWTFVATDLAGHDVTFNMPLVFIYGEDPATQFEQSEFSPTWTSLVAERYAATTFHAIFSATGGVPLTFAPETTDASGKTVVGGTTHPTLGITLGVSQSNADPNAPADDQPAGLSSAALQSAGQPDFYPTIANAQIRLHAADALTGGPFTGSGNDPLASLGGVAFEYYPPYVSSGSSNFGPDSARGGRGADSPNATVPNLGSVYAQALHPPALNFPANSVGGVGTPNIAVTALSAALGALGSSTNPIPGGGGLTYLDQYAQEAQAIVTDYFATAQNALGAAQLLGGLSLGDILAGVQSVAGPQTSEGSDTAGDSSINLFNTPTISAQLDQQTGVLTVTYTLNTPLTSWAPSSLPASQPIFAPDDPSGSLTLTAVFTVDPGSHSPVYTVNGSVDPFTTYLIGQGSALDFISLHFESLTFSASTGTKPTVNVNLDTVAFDGVLTFVNTLEQFLESLGGGGLAVDVTPTEVTVATSISVPDIAVGIFTLTGISFNAGVTVPFLDGPAVGTFSFATQDNPFTLTVAMFGGGGFLALALNFGGVHSVSASLEFTGQFALDVYVASGSLSLSAGIYFNYTNGSGTTITGFVRAIGQISILGIITVSASLDLSLSYASADNSVTGQAAFCTSISICGFSKSISFTVTKTFAGAGGSNAAMVSGADRRALSAGPLDTGTIIWEDLVTQPQWVGYCSAFAPPSASANAPRS